MPRQTLTKRADGRYACKYEGRFFYGKTANEAFRKRDDYVRMQERGYNMGLIDTSFAEYGRPGLTPIGPNAIPCSIDSIRASSTMLLSILVKRC